MIKTHIFKKLELSTMLIKERRESLDNLLSKTTEKLDSMQEEINDNTININSSIRTIRNELNKTI
jgi:hypothetical protein